MPHGCANTLKRVVQRYRGRQNDTRYYTSILFDTTREKLIRAKHVPGAKCKCDECKKLKEFENNWILKIGSFYGSSGLNSRHEIKSKTQSKWKEGP